MINRPTTSTLLSETPVRIDALTGAKLVSMTLEHDGYPDAYGQFYGTVKPFRDENARPKIRDLWWLYAWERPKMYRATAGLARHLGTVKTSKHRCFADLGADALANNSAVVLALEDSYHFGVLSSRIPTTWSAEKGGSNGAGNDPRYSHPEVFDRFPFPAATDAQLK